MFKNQHMLKSFTSLPPELARKVLMTWMEVSIFTLNEGLWAHGRWRHLFYDDENLWLTTEKQPPRQTYLRFSITAHEWKASAFWTQVFLPDDYSSDIWHLSIHDATAKRNVEDKLFNVREDNKCLYRLWRAWHVTLQHTNKHVVGQ